MRLLLEKYNYPKNLRAFSNGFTLLHEAVNNNSVECIHVLCQYGFDIEARANKGSIRGINKYNKDGSITTEKRIFLNQCTPLHLAAIKGLSECVKALLELGADIQAVNEEGHTALELAQGQGHQNCIEVLESYKLQQESFSFNN